MRRAVSAAAAVAAFAAALAAQQQTPRIPHAGYVYPAGGRRGATIEVRVGGEFLNGASAVYISGQGVQAKVTQYLKPLSPAEAQKLRDEIQKLRDKRAASQKPAAAGSPNVVFTAADRKRIAEIRDKLEEVQRRPSIPAIAEVATLQVAIAPNAAVGPRQLRLDTAGGLTNPIVFWVGELPEISRKPVRVAPAYNVVNGATPAPRAAPRPPEPPMEITLPAVVNGQMTPGTADQYRFQAKRGQHLVVAATARELIPYVSDAVPGWFQAALTLRDAQGKELASADHFLFHPDPLLDYEIPSDGEYIAEIHDSIFRDARISSTASPSANCRSSPASSRWVGRPGRAPPSKRRAGTCPWRESRRISRARPKACIRSPCGKTDGPPTACLLRWIRCRRRWPARGLATGKERKK